MDSQRSGGNPMEPNWAALIRAELEAHSPRGPARFTPRLLPERPQRRRWVRPLAVALAVLLVAIAVVTGAAATQPGGIAGTLQRAVHQLTGRQIGPAASPTPGRNPANGVVPSGAGGSTSTSPGQVIPGSSATPGAGGGAGGGGTNPGSSPA